MKQKRQKQHKPLYPPHGGRYFTRLPDGYWQVILALYFIPPLLERQLFTPGHFLVEHMAIYAIWILPVIFLCYYFGLRGGGIAALGTLPFLVWHLGNAIATHAVYFTVLTSYYALFVLFALACGLMSEILRRQTLALTKEAVTDELSGLYNYRFFYHCLEKEVDRARRYQLPLSLVIIDLDNFKNYNDTHGHPQGDRALATAARVLKDTVRTSDTVARYGGEEFAIILPQTSLAQAKQLCERIREALASTPIPSLEGVTDPLTASFGVTAYENGMTARQFVSETDRILYFAKSSGKNLVTCR
jgi:diguanylate cyclase (GGDEF)-like protein